MYHAIYLRGKHLEKLGHAVESNPSKTLAPINF